MNNSSVVNWQHTIIGKSSRGFLAVVASLGLGAVSCHCNIITFGYLTQFLNHKVTKCDYIACMQKWHICKGIIVCMYFMLFECSELDGKISSHSVCAVRLHAGACAVQLVNDGEAGS